MNTYLADFIREFIEFVVPQNSLKLIIDNPNDKKIKGTYNYIIVLKILETEQDIQKFLDNINKHLKPNGRVIIIYQNYLQSFLRGFVSTEKIDRNWLSTTDIANFLNLSGFEITTHQPLCLVPYNIPFFSKIINRLLLYFFPFNHLSFLHYFIGRKVKNNKQSSISIIIPCRNEAGNIDKLFQKLPKICKKQEVVFIEGHSKDNTYQEIESCIRKYKEKVPYKFQLLKQKKGSGKADAVRIGFEKAKNEILAIYDADMSVKASQIRKFYQAIVSGKGNFINGSRLVYPMEKKAMQYLNILGNKIFSIIFSWLLGQNIKDTLCGTKVLFKKDYELMKKDKRFFGKYDPFGDFDLLLGASLLNLKIIDLPVRYYERTYGSTNIKRFKNALELFRLSFIALIRLKMRLS